MYKNNMFIEKINNYEDGATFLLKLPVEEYFYTNNNLVKSLLYKNYQGIYISFQRPLKNILNSFKQNNIDCKKIKIIDYASEDMLINDYNDNYTKISTLNINIILKDIIDNLTKIKTKNKFILIDSL